ncbi:MAG: AmmeMemoRadiSam system radical SAM enzyme [Candidatus Aenigmatarchaeota archaeon]|nr:MAG: AmmeMemoRadiSam system radical SAM enzyme [Candidatus Aenigmarchaeota archaeon]
MVRELKEASFWKPLPGNRVRCELCPRGCQIPENGWGFCRTRQNLKGKLYTAVYGLVCAINPDPIEKKPIFHFAPGSLSLSFSTTGCNLRCRFCQNFEISQSEPFGQEMPPERIVELAVEKEIPGIAYTYTEPTVFFEFALDTMKLAKKEKLYNVWVSNGFTSPEAIKRAGRYLDAINVDLKGDLKFYQELCGIPSEKPVYRALKAWREEGVWIELTNLLIPGWNDGDQQIRKLVGWIKRNLGPDTPLHFSRFFPYYLMQDHQPTPFERLDSAYRIARDLGMKWVYVGNVPGHQAESTYCPECGNLLIERTGYITRVVSTRCECGVKLPLRGRKWMRRSS